MANGREDAVDAESAWLTFESAGKGWQMVVKTRWMLNRPGLLLSLQVRGGKWSSKTEYATRRSLAKTYAFNFFVDALLEPRFLSQG